MLLKSVLSTLLIYFLSFFKIHVVVCSKLTSLHRKFFWGGNCESTKIVLVKWDKICMSKNTGGLGVPNIFLYNTALLGKWWSKYYAKENNLWKQIVLHKYYNGESWREIVDTQCSSISNVWSNIISLGNADFEFSNVHQ